MNQPISEIRHQSRQESDPLRKGNKQVRSTIIWAYFLNSSAQSGDSRGRTLISPKYKIHSERPGKPRWLEFIKAEYQRGERWRRGLEIWLAPSSYQLISRCMWETAWARGKKHPKGAEVIIPRFTHHSGSHST